MDILNFIIPLSLVLVGVIVGAFLWAVRSGQFDDLEGPAHRILHDDEDGEVEEEPAPSRSDERARDTAGEDRPR